MDIKKRKYNDQTYEPKEEYKKMEHEDEDLKNNLSKLSLRAVEN